MAFIREDISTKFLSADTNSIDVLYIALNFHKRQWLLSFLYNPNKNNIMNHLDASQKNLDLYISEYEHVRDFNIETKEPYMQSFLKLYGLRNLISEPTCYKNPENPSSIDLILTNSSSSFQHPCALETSLSDFHKIHKMTSTVMITTFQKLIPKKLLSRLSIENISNTSNGLKNFLRFALMF